MKRKKIWQNIWRDMISLDFLVCSILHTFMQTYACTYRKEERSIKSNDLIWSGKLVALYSKLHRRSWAIRTKLICMAMKHICRPCRLLLMTFYVTRRRPFRHRIDFNTGPHNFNAVWYRYLRQPSYVIYIHTIIDRETRER